MNPQNLPSSLPPAAHRHLEAVITAVTTTLSADSIILLGSAARGELSTRPTSSGKIELFSDYECMVVVGKRPSAAERTALQTKLTKLEQQIDNPNPLFHIDIIIREKKRIKSLPPIIFTVEMKKNGRILYGYNTLSEIPDVTLNNLDLRNTNEILYKRLWALLLHLPEKFILAQSMNAAEKRVAGYVLCRNALDITTVLLPHEGVLLPTYEERVLKLQETYSALNFACDFDSDFPDFLQNCLDLRQTLQFNDMDMQAWYAKTIHYLTLALHQIGFETDAPSASPVYNEWPISRGEWYNLAYMMQRHARDNGIRKTIQWLRASKKKWLTSGLLAMHKALIAWQLGDEKMAVNHLQQSQQLLNQLLMRETAVSSAQFPQYWLNLRQQWAEFWRSYIRLNDAKYIQRFKVITTWQYQ